MYSAIYCIYILELCVIGPVHLWFSSLFMLGGFCPATAQTSGDERLPTPAEQS